MATNDDIVVEPLKAVANGSVVVVTGDRGVAAGMTPEAVLDSLEPLRLAAEQAVRNRDAGIEPE